MTTQPRKGFVRVPSQMPPPPAASRMRGKNVCPTKKYRYPSEALALEGLARVRGDRVLAGDARPPECRIYFCDRCEGWHLTSNEAYPDLFDTEPEKRSQEDWRQYAARLEKRIASQRSEILSLHQLGHGISNKSTRRRMETLVIALGRATERFERERRDRVGLVRLLENRCWWCRTRMRLDRLSSRPGQGG